MSNDFASIVIKNIQRRLEGRTPYWLSKESGVSQAALSKLLNLKESPRLDTLAKLAAVFKCQLWELLVDETTRPVDRRLYNIRDFGVEKIVQIQELEKITSLQKEAITGLKAQLKLKDAELDKILSGQRQKIKEQTNKEPPINRDDSRVLQAYEKLEPHQRAAVDQLLFPNESDIEAASRRAQAALALEKPKPKGS